MKNPFAPRLELIPGAEIPNIKDIYPDEKESLHTCYFIPLRVQHYARATLATRHSCKAADAAGTCDRFGV